MDSDTRTADEINAMSPSECWEVYVGSQSAADWLSMTDHDANFDGMAIADECALYTSSCPLCDDLDKEARSALACKLAAYIAADTADEQE